MFLGANATSNNDRLASFDNLFVETSSEVSRLVMHAITLIDSDETVAIDLMKKASTLLRPHPGSKDIRKRPATGGLAPWQENRVTKYIEENLSTAISLNELARLVRLSTSYFSAAFKVSFDMSPHNYIISRRVEHAKHRMANSTASLSEIALDCGLSDQAHLSRIFRRATGKTPSAWRRFSISH
ncbi:helix-turn-helix domain-containing protein [Agrobacterium tumefaciens]|uniref:helix-turn-helix domain-containing protein n=1 Tax=Agrobacterium tumefaciens TaxID=358 RepID=UPI0027804FA1|nr:AraC family transcriptional regulator [Agrobacterium tumefaciens]MDP9857474.1 AraC-like DNA-binding protein [Agrobacterium tumefaciens]